MKWTGWLAGTVIVFALSAYALNPKADATFHNLNEIKAKFMAAGLHCTSDSVDGKIRTGFLVSRGDVSWYDVSTLCKVGSMGPEWKDKVWITINNERWQLQSTPDHAGTRSWGNFVAFGDESFLNEVDEVLQ